MCKSFSFVLEQWLKPPVPEPEEETVVVPQKGIGGLLFFVLFMAVLGGAAGYFFLGIIGAAVGAVAGILAVFLFRSLFR